MLASGFNPMIGVLCLRRSTARSVCGANLIRTSVRRAGCLALALQAVVAARGGFGGMCASRLFWYRGVAHRGIDGISEMWNVTWFYAVSGGVVILRSNGGRAFLH